MSKQAAIAELVKQQGILPLFYNDDPEVSVHTITALYNAGVKTVEYTNRGAQALANYKYLLQQRTALWPDLKLGIGTIKNSADATDFINAGADYIICPGFNAFIAETANSADVAWVPGCMTPSEIMEAESYGARLVKLFPGNILGPSFVSAVKEVFPKLMFMPTGGVDVTEENIGGWFKGGVSAVGLGSKLISKTLLEQKDFAAIEKLTRQALDIVARLRA